MIQTDHKLHNIKDEKVCNNKTLNLDSSTHHRDKKRYQLSQLSQDGLDVLEHRNNNIREEMGLTYNKN